jgi:signal transduction histidine kinase
MTLPEPGPDELRVLLVAPTGADARLSQRVLADAGMTCTVYTDVATVCAALPQGVGAVVLTEESLAGGNLHRLSAALTRQPPWSDVPIIVLTHAGTASSVAKYALDTLGNVIVLDRPVRVATLVSAVRTALRGRERQYQIRAHLQEREQLYAAEQQARAAAEAAVALRDAFLSIAAHELKTPLTTLLGNIQLVERRIARNGGLGERDQHAIQVASQQAGRLKRMIDALLDVSRLEQGQLSITHDPVDVGLLVERIVQEVRPGLQQHIIESHTPAEAAVILGDELRLEQVLQNLIQNAIKYSPAGGTIDVTVECDATHVAVRVRDPGVGIPADALPHLFERFYRVSDAVERHIQGVGIGLYVVKEIVALHGGWVEVTSQEGVGSTFIVWLPLFEDPDVQDMHANRPVIAAERHDIPTIVSTPRDAGVSSILVVDDDPAIRAMLSKSM